VPHPTMPATRGKAEESDIPLPRRRPSLGVEESVVYPETMTRGGAFSFAGVWAGDKTNWSSEPCERCEALDACEASDELESLRRCMGRLGIGIASLREWFQASISPM